MRAFSIGVAAQAKEKGSVPPLVIAHRGASAESAENSLAAFRRALALGADGIELDVRLTRDGVPVVFHDATLRRLTLAKGRIVDRTWAELRALRVRGTEPIPRLEDVLRFVHGRAVVQIELKAGPVPPVVRAVRAARAAGWVILASFDWRLVTAARDFAPDIPRMLISEGRAAPAALIRRLAACGAAGLSVHHRAVTSAAWLRHFHQRGYAVWTWTVNDPGTTRRLAGWGIDALLGDDPALLQNAL